MSAALPADQRLLRVIKVGGSLLDWQPLATQLLSWIASQPQATNVLIAGGGPLADAIRRADAIHGLGEQLSHDLCIELLGVTARLLRSILREHAQLASWGDTVKLRSEQYPADIVVLDPRDFMQSIANKAGSAALPHSWDTTSDSIAASVACALSADELVLLKSCGPSTARNDNCDFRSLADEGYVDRHFPMAVSSFSGRVRLVNLRDVTSA